MSEQQKESFLEREARERCEAKDWAEKSLGEKLGFGADGDPDAWNVHDSDSVAFTGTDEEWAAMSSQEKLVATTATAIENT